MAAPITRLSRAQVREIDRRSIEEYHIPGIVLMENAAREVVDFLLTLPLASRSADIVCGGGNNGGDGLAVARHLHNRGWQVRILLAVDPARYAGDALVNWEICERMRIPVISGTQVSDELRASRPGIIIDALFGTGLIQPPRDDAMEIIDAMNGNGAPILAIDLPSGLNCDTGEALGQSCVRASYTITFVAEKAGFANPASGQFTGKVVVADIGCPRELVEAIAGGR